MKIIFLDIDGVLNRGGDEEGRLNPDLVKIFNDILTRVDVDVVISSSWKSNGLALEYIRDGVCNFSNITPTAYLPSWHSTQMRGIEIQLYLDNHKNVDKYAIIDDTGWIFEHQLPNFFKTKSEIGLTKEIAEKIIKHLT